MNELMKNKTYPATVSCSLCGMEVNKNETVSNACFRYCNDCAKKYPIPKNQGITHMKSLFVKEERPHEFIISVCIETISGRPCIESLINAYGGCGCSADVHYHEISYETLKDIAKNTSEKLYEKYKDINESNWREYIINE